MDATWSQRYFGPLQLIQTAGAAIISTGCGQVRCSDAALAG